MLLFIVTFPLFCYSFLLFGVFFQLDVFGCNSFSYFYLYVSVLRVILDLRCQREIRMEEGVIIYHMYHSVLLLFF